MIRESIQLEMNFDGTNENRFKQRFDLGEFQLIAELPVPSADTPLTDAVRRASDFEYLVHSQEGPKASIAFVNEAPADRDYVGVLTCINLCPDPAEKTELPVAALATAQSTTTVAKLANGTKLTHQAAALAETAARLAALTIFTSTETHLSM